MLPGQTLEWTNTHMCTQSKVKSRKTKAEKLWPFSTFNHRSLILPGPEKVNKLGDLLINCIFITENHFPCASIKYYWTNIERIEIWWDVWSGNPRYLGPISAGLKLNSQVFLPPNLALGPQRSWVQKGKPSNPIANKKQEQRSLSKSVEHLLLSEVLS